MDGNTFVYFTNISNLAVLIFYAFAVINGFFTFKEKQIFNIKAYTRIKAMITISISITFIIYFLLLSDSSLDTFLRLKIGYYTL